VVVRSTLRSNKSSTICWQLIDVDVDAWSLHVSTLAAADMTALVRGRFEKCSELETP
jgi:hypothetical protein